jgi:hypothetical protein
MKRLIAIVLVLMVCGVAYGSNIGMEPLLNKCFDGTTSLRTQEKPGSTIRTGQMTIKIIGDASEQLTRDSVAINEITVSVLPTNASAVYIGVSSDTLLSADIASTGYCVSPDVTLPINNVNLLWVSGDTVGDGVSWIGIVR